VNAPMRDYSPKSSYESDNVPRSKAVTCRAVRTMIGQELRARYEVPQDLSHEMLTLLLKLNEHDEEELMGIYRPVLPFGPAVREGRSGSWRRRRHRM
jgi:hypothetical protein